MYYYRHAKNERDVGFKVECVVSDHERHEIGMFDVETSAMILVHFLNGGSGVSYSTVVNVLNERKQ